MMPDIRDRDLMYNLIIRQLSFDGHHQFALDLLQISGLPPHLPPPSDDLLSLFTIAKHSADDLRTREREPIRQIRTASMTTNIAQRTSAPKPNSPIAASSTSASSEDDQSSWSTVSSSKHRNKKAYPSISRPPCKPETSAKRHWNGENRKWPKQPHQRNTAVKGSENEKKRYDDMMGRLLNETENISSPQRNRQLHQIATWLLLREASKVVMEARPFQQISRDEFENLRNLRAEVSDMTHNSGLCLPHRGEVIQLQKDFYKEHESAIIHLSNHYHFSIKKFV